jgi:hypothetical protein
MFFGDVAEGFLKGKMARTGETGSISWWMWPGPDYVDITFQGTHFEFALPEILGFQT